MLKERKVNLEVTAAARDAIIAEGYDPQYGARPMRRAIQRLIQDPLALQLLNGDYLEGDTVLVDADVGQVVNLRRVVNPPGERSSPASVSEARGGEAAGSQTQAIP